MAGQSMRTNIIQMVQGSLTEIRFKLKRWKGLSCFQVINALLHGLDTLSCHDIRLVLTSTTELLAIKTCEAFMEEWDGTLRVHTDGIDGCYYLVLL